MEGCSNRSSLESRVTVISHGLQSAGQGATALSLLKADEIPM